MLVCARLCIISYLSNNENIKIIENIKKNMKIVQCYIPLKLF